MIGKCPKHPGTQLRFQCSSCGETLCASCVDRRRMGTTTISMCPECKASVSPLDPGEVPLFAIARDALFEPFRRVDSFLRLSFGALFCTLLNILVQFTEITWFHYSITGLMALFFVAYLAATVKNAIGGMTEIPNPLRLSSILDDLVSPALYFVGALVLSLMPLILIILVSDVVSDSPDLILTTWQTDPGTKENSLLLIVVVYALFLAPMAVPVALYTKHLFNATNPLLLLQMVARIPLGYFSALLMLYFSLFAISGAGVYLYRAVMAEGNPAYSGFFLGWWFAFYGGFVFAAIDGGMLFTYSKKLKIRIHSPINRSSYTNGLSTYPPPYGQTLHSRPSVKRKRTSKAKELGSRLSATRPVANVVPISYPPQTPEDSSSSAPSDGAKASRPPQDADRESSPPGSSSPSPARPYDLISVPPAKRSTPPPRETSGKSTPPKGLANPPSIETLSQRYRERIREKPGYILAPELQWAVASFLERRGEWDAAIEAYAKLGMQPLKHPRGADGLLRASYLAYSKLENKKQTTELLLALIDRYPEHASAEKGIKVLSAISRHSSP